MIGVIILLIFIGWLIWHMSNTGTYYIEFDGSEYWVWLRQFGGYNRCQGHFKTEAEAKECIERRKANPPRTIEDAK